MPQKFRVLLLVVLALVWLTPRTGRAEDSRHPANSWAARYPSIEGDVAAGKPLTLLVVVPLCDSRLIRCGGQGAGDPGSLDKNLYWGRAFGARRYFEGAGQAVPARGYARWQRISERTAGTIFAR